MAEKRFSISQNEQGVYHLEGELSIHDLEDLKGFLEGFRKNEKEVTLSFEKVRFIDTAALQLLIVFKKHLEPKVKLRISAVSDEVEKILSLSGLKSALM